MGPFYKVVVRLNEKLYSCSTPKMLCKEYVVGIPTIAYIGGLLVFDTFIHARNFGPLALLECELYRCDCEDQVPLPPYAVSISDCIVKCPDPMTVVQRAWENNISDILTATSCFEWPHGTKAFKKVTLKERVE